MPEHEPEPEPESEATTSSSADAVAKRSRVGLGPVRFWILGVVAALAAGFVMLLWADTFDTGRSLRARAPSGTSGGEVAAVPIKLLGRVLLESAPADGDDGATDRSPPLEPPPKGQCTISGWQNGKRLGSPVTCRADGGFELVLPGEVVGRVFVELRVPGRLRGYLDATVGEEREIGLEAVALGLGYEVSGQAVDRRGRPVVGARVEAMPSPNLGETEPWRADTDEEGRFRFTTLPVGPVRLRAKKPGFSESVVEAVAPEAHVTVVLDGLKTLEGHVVGPPGLASAPVARLEGSSFWPPISQAVAADGSFRFEALPDGIYGVEVIVPSDKVGAPEYASIPLENVTPDMRISLALIEAFRVPVRVVDVTGDPVPKARVTLGYAQVGLLQRQEVADAQGRARVGPVVPGPYVLRAHADGYLAGESVALDVGSEECPEQVLTLARPARIEGIVLDERDEPVEGAEIVVDTDTEQGFDTRRQTSLSQLFHLAFERGTGSLGVTDGKVPGIFDDAGLSMASGGLTDKKGQFVLDMLPPGTYRVSARHADHAQSAVLSIEVGPSEIRAGLELRLREGFPLTGRIRDTNRRPVARARVEVGEDLVLWTDSRGVFDAGVVRGPQTLWLHKSKMVPRKMEVDVQSPGLDLELTLEAAEGSLSGRARDRNLQPVAGVSVTLWRPDATAPAEITFTDEKGAFVFDGLAPGAIEIQLAHRDYVAQRRAVKVRARADVPQEFELVPAQNVVLTVRGEGRGDPIPGAAVRWKGSHTRTDRLGRADLRGLPAGEAISVQISAPGWIGQRLDVDGSRPEWTLDLRLGGAVEGLVSDDIGDALPRAKIVVSSGDVRVETRSRGDGSFRADGLPEGDIDIEVTPPPEREGMLVPSLFRSDVLRGETTRDVHIRLERDLGGG